MAELKTTEPSNVCNYFIVTCTLFDKDDSKYDGDEHLLSYDESELKIITEIVKKEKFPIKRGDLVRMQCAARWYSSDRTDLTNYYRNSGVLIFNGEMLEELSYAEDIDEYGAIPPCYVLYEEPDYFNSKYWHFNQLYDHAGICHNNIVWIECDNILLTNLQSKLVNDKLVISTFYIDCRGAKHYIVADLDIYKFIPNLETVVNKFTAILKQEKIKLNAITEIDYLDDINLDDFFDKDANILWLVISKEDCQ